MIIDENTSIKDLTNGQYSTLSYNSSGDNYAGPLVNDIVRLIDRAGSDVTNTQVSSVGSTFKNIVMNYQKANNLPVTGIVDDDLLHDIYRRANEKSNNEIIDTSDFDSQYNASELESSVVADAHYDPFFLNNSGKVYRKNHKDIIISLGNGANTKTIKDVFMRSVSVQVDTSGNPVTEVYSFIARDVKESDAPEDVNKYIGDSEELSSSSDIKYSYDTLFKDI